MKYFYHIRCDPDLDEGLCAMWIIPCDYTGCIEQPSKPWLTHLDKTLQPRYAIELKTCKYYSILSGYNKCYIWNFDFKNILKTKTRRRLKMSLYCTEWPGQQQTRLNTIKLVNFKPETVPRLDIILFDR